MRKPRDYDSELKALDDKARRLKERKVQQLGELVVACGTDALSPEHLAGALLGIAETKDAATKEGWRKRGAAFFQRSPRKAVGKAPQKPDGTLPFGAGAASA
jgi:DNA-binding protein H-NS